MDLGREGGVGDIGGGMGEHMSIDIGTGNCFVCRKAVVVITGQALCGMYFFVTAVIIISYMGRAASNKFHGF